MKLLLGLMMLATVAGASEKTDSDWRRQLRAQGLPASEQAYCYTDEAGAVTGTNVNLRVRIASVSKLLISLWSVDQHGVDYKYKTKLFIKGDKLHIAGSFDPFLGDEKMFFLISQLNELGFTHFSSVTFDKNLMINPDVLFSSDEYPPMNSAWNARHLNNYFNTASWSQARRNEYNEYYSLAKQGRFLKNVQMTADEVKMTGSNPFEDAKDAVMFTLSSPELFRYLKQMNIKSNNYVAETLFRELGGRPAFEKFLQDRFGLSGDTVKFYTGSGLPFIDNTKKRFDNYATCAVVLSLTNELKKLVESQKKELEDLVAVPGSDGGTFRNRIFPEDYKNSFVAKTGTLVHTSALAGAMNTQKGFSFFGIFNQSEDIAGSKIVQNSMVKSIMTEMGGPRAFDYVVDGFHTYDGDTLKNKQFITNVEDFSTIEKGLY